jgi:hypothetical protein
MSEEIKIIVQDKLRKKICEIKTKRPRTFELLINFINEKIKEMPKYYTIYISKNGKGIEINSDQQYQIYKNKTIYILEKDIADISSTLIQKEEVYLEDTMNNTMNENSDTKNVDNNNEINEINEKPKEINDQFIENLSDILKKILIRFKEVDTLLPEYNEKLNELVNKIEPNFIISQINNISDIILDELKIIEDYIKSKGNNNKNLPKIDIKKKGPSNLNLVFPNLPNDINKAHQNPGIDIPFSCIPRIQKKTYEDISFEKIGKK